MQYKSSPNREIQKAEKTITLKRKLNAQQAVEYILSGLAKPSVVRKLRAYFGI